MHPRIDNTRFGSITIAGVNYGHDVLVRLDGEVTKRKKKLSKDLYGTSHVLSLAEAQYVFESGAEKVVFGTGHFGKAGLSPEAETFFAQNNCVVELLPTPQAVEAWNISEGAVIGLFHITC